MALPLQRHADASLHAAVPVATGTHDVLAGLPAGSVWQASRLAQAGGAVLPTGFAALDAELPGGGWPAGALIELLADRPGVGELSLLLPLLGATLRTLDRLHRPAAAALRPCAGERRRAVVAPARRASRTP